MGDDERSVGKRPEGNAVAVTSDGYSRHVLVYLGLQPSQSMPNDEEQYSNSLDCSDPPKFAEFPFDVHGRF